MTILDPRQFDPSQFWTGKGQPSVDQLARIHQSWEKGPLDQLKAHLLRAFETSVRYVGGWRSLADTVDGQSNIVQNLHKWKSPTQPEKHLRHRFKKIEQLFRDLMRDIEIEPEHMGQNLHLTINGRYVSIRSCGDGVQHLLMIAYHLVTAPGGVLLIEEPETHLHPELQRNLLRILRRELNGQSIITTHSPVLLDTGGVGAVYRIEHDSRCSSGCRCDTSDELYRVRVIRKIGAPTQRGEGHAAGGGGRGFATPEGQNATEMQRFLLGCCTFWNDRRSHPWRVRVGSIVDR